MGKTIAGEARGQTSIGSSISTGRIISDDANKAAKDGRMDTGLSAWSLATAQIIKVDYETLRVTLKILTGSGVEPIRDGVPLTFPGGGRRHFFGSLPLIGDFCLVGWSSANSEGQAMARYPRILGYFPAPAWMGRDWLPGQEFGPKEMPGGGNNMTINKMVEGLADRVRFKLRHTEPGNIVASSAQGSDLVLDESVTLANRRGNEIRLREQDQALVTRSVNQFHAMAGARVYAGQVQRDARHLPPEMFSDGVYWDAPNLVGMDEVTLDGSCPYGAGALLGAQPFRRTPDEDGETSPASDFARDGRDTPGPSIDPFHFLRWGSFIDGGTRLNSTDFDKMAVQGGKAYYRVSLNPPNSDMANVTGSRNGALIVGDTTPKSLSEYRIEVTHTSTGILPVTEQTDGFDAERLPASTGGNTTNAPFVEVVYGSVVGNDPFSGIDNYGVPLAPKIQPTPALESGVGKPILQHAATLFRVKPLTGGEHTWFSVNKSGKVFANMPSGLDLNIGGSSYNFGSGGAGVGISTGGVLDLRGDGQGGDPAPFGINIQSNNNAIRIYGGARSTMGVAGAETPSAAEEMPNVLIEGRDNILLQAASRVTINANVLDLSNIQQIEMASQNQMALSSGDMLEQTSNNVRIGSQETLRISSSGGNPLNDPPYFHTLTCNPSTMHVPFTPSYVVEQPTGGSYEFTSSMGDFDTEVLVGSQTFSSPTGGVTMQSMGGGNSAQVGVAGYSSSIGVGSYSATALSGPMTLSSSVAATVSATGGPATVRSSSALLLGAPTAVPGPLMTGMVICPLFGIPFMTMTACDTGAVRSPA